MTTCLLCKKDEANAKGSHIIPSFIMQPAINEMGKTGRDKEAFMVLGLRSVSTYFGRKTSPEKINQLLGRDLSEEESKNQSTELVMDNVFCQNCENRLAKIESIYSKKNKTRQNLNDDIIETGCNSKLACLFWLSIGWRIQVTELVDAAFTPEDLESIRKILDKFLLNDETALVQSIEEIDLGRITIRILHGFEEVEDTERFILARRYGTSSLALLIDKFCVLISDAESTDVQDVNNFFGLSLLFRNSTINPTATNEKMSVVNNKNAVTVIMKVREEKAIQFIQQIRFEISNQITYVTRLIPSPIIVEHILSEIVYSEKGEISDIERYTPERINKKIGIGIMHYYGK